MKCPLCRTTAMELKEIETDLLAFACPSCLGNWLQSYRYRQWRNRSGHADGASSALSGDFQTGPEPHVVKLCPECGYFLILHRVGHGLNFYLDCCGNCGGMWFDAAEWDRLKALNLHQEVHRVFSAVWQREIADMEAAGTRERRLSQILGPKDYEEVMRIRKWIDQHPRKDTLLACLTQDSK